MSYYILESNEAKGPYTLGQLRAMWNSGAVTGQTLHCQEGDAQWQPLHNMLGELEPPAAPPQIPAPIIIQPAYQAAPQRKKRLGVVSGCLFLVLGLPILAIILFSFSPASGPRSESPSTPPAPIHTPARTAGPRSPAPVEAAEPASAQGPTFSSTSQAAADLCEGIEKNINALLPSTHTGCLPTKGQNPDAISFIILSEQPVFGTQITQKPWLLTAVGAVGRALNDHPAFKAEELWLSDLALTRQGKAYVIDAATAKSLQQQIYNEKITLDQMYEGITTKGVLKTVQNQ